MKSGQKKKKRETEIEVSIKDISVEIEYRDAFIKRLQDKYKLFSILRLNAILQHDLCKIIRESITNWSFVRETNRRSRHVATHVARATFTPPSTRKVARGNISSTSNEIIKVQMWNELRIGSWKMKDAGKGE